MTCWFLSSFLFWVSALSHLSRRTRQPVLKVEMRATPRCQRLHCAALVLRHPQWPMAQIPTQQPPVSPSGVKFRGPSRTTKCSSACQQLCRGLQPVTEPQAGPASRGRRARKKKSPPPPRFEVVERRTGIRLMRAKQRLG